MNRITLTGRLTQEPERKDKIDANNGGVVSWVNMTLANNDNKTRTLFIDAVAFGKLGETMSKYLHKGDPVLISGSLSRKDWTTKDGQKRSSYGIIVDSFEFMSTAKSNEGASEDEEDECF